MSMWIISRGVVLLILLMEYKVLRDFLLHRSSINNSARLSNKFGGFYFSFKFDISGLLHHVITTIAYRIRDKDTSQSKQNLQSSSMTFIHKTLIIPSVLDSCFISSTVSEVKRGESNVISNVLIPKNEVKGVTTRAGKMRSEANHIKKINETGFNKNEPPIFKQDVQEKPHDDGVENNSSSIHERTTQPLVKPQQSSVPFPNRVRKEKEEALQRNFLELEEACTETMNERCSAVLLNELPSKEKDHRSFTTPYQVLEKHKEAEDLAADHLSRFENPHMEELTERCVAGSETLEILAHCHSGPTGGHHSANVTAKKVYEAGFYWPSVFKDANEYAKSLMYGD
ncbi:hypothetical protein Tco_0425101 [Tanacetum coccineum]